LGETGEIFNKIAPGLPGKHTYISLWDSLDTKRRRKLGVINFCKELIDTYNIQKNDIIIGHSTGGRLAHYIKHLNGNRIIQIASWTTQGKPLFPIKNRKVIYFLVRSGMLLSRLGSKYMIENYKRRDKSKPYYIDAIRNMQNGNRNCVVNQFKLALEPVNEEVNTCPDLRIHAKRDNIVRYPNEAYTEVPGDHFSLVTHPTKVVTNIKAFLETV
jgi:hypothetical protein